MPSTADADLAHCDQEPVHIPGHIQPFGCLLVVDPHDYTVLRASANTAAFLPSSQGPGALLGRPLTETLACSSLLASLEDELATQQRAVQYLDLGREGEAFGRFCLAGHHTEAGLVLELEPAAGATEEGHTQTLRRLDRFVQMLPRHREPLALLDYAAREIQQETGMQRAMVYRFDADHNGQIIIEATDGAPQTYIGQHFPASDIPQPARDLYRRTRIRIIPDTLAEPVPLQTAPGTGTAPLDLGHALLRGVSPIHREYMHNMGVRATLVTSLLDEAGDLWGMLVCHHPHPLHPPFPVRLFCSLASDILSSHLSLLERSQQDAANTRSAEEANRIFRDLPRTDDPCAYIHEREADLLALFDAQAAALCLHGRCQVLGARAVPAPVLQGLEQYAAEITHGEEIHHTQRVADLPTMAGVDPDWVAGMLYIPLGERGGDYLILLRAEQVATIDWAGNPNKAVLMHPDTDRLSPRKSFETWKEEVRGKSAAWAEHHEVAARRVGQLVGLYQGYQVRQARELERELQHQAHHDHLTGLPNRTLLLDRLEHALKRGQRHGHALGLLFLDLDGFKPVNDRLGHEAGDELLRQVGSRVACQVRDADTAGRLGGDEFVVLVEEIARPEDTMATLAERLIAALGEPFSVKGQEVNLGASVGVAIQDCQRHPCEVGQEVARLLRRADEAMYCAKRDGSNQYVISSEP